MQHQAIELDGSRPSEHLLHEAPRDSSTSELRICEDVEDDRLTAERNIHATVGPAPREGMYASDLNPRTSYDALGLGGQGGQPAAILATRDRFTEEALRRCDESADHRRRS